MLPYPWDIILNAIYQILPFSKAAQKTGSSARPRNVNTTEGSQLYVWPDVNTQKEASFTYDLRINMPDCSILKATEWVCVLWVYFLCYVSISSLLRVSVLFLPPHCVSVCLPCFAYLSLPFSSMLCVYVFLALWVCLPCFMYLFLPCVVSNSLLHLSSSHFVFNSLLHLSLPSFVCLILCYVYIFRFVCLSSLFYVSTSSLCV